MAEELKTAGVNYFGVGLDNTLLTQSHKEIAKYVYVSVTYLTFDSLRLILRK